MPDAHQPVEGHGRLAQAASRDVQFNLTDKGIDFLGYKTLRNLLGSLGKSSFGSHDTPYLATGIEADGWSKQYEFGDVLNLDVNETLKNSLAPHRQRSSVPIDLDYADLMVRQAEYRSSCATVLMLDMLALDDPVRRGSLHAGEEGRARAHAPHPHAVPRRHAPGRPLPRLGGGDPAGDARARAGGPVPHEHGRGAQARAAASCWRRRRTCGRSS